MERICVFHITKLFMMDHAEFLEKTPNVIYPYEVPTTLNEVQNLLLKICCESLNTTPNKYNKQSFTKHIFSTKLKQAEVYSKHKRGDQTQESNFRSISILPAISKVIEEHILLII